MKRTKDLTTLTFVGPRFEDHGLDIDVLPELLAYKRLLIETAKELWRAENPTRQRLPKGFEDKLRLKFYDIEKGSTAIPIKRVMEVDEFLLPFETTDEVDEAAQLIDESIASIEKDGQLPDRLPRNVIPMFIELGERLEPDEGLRMRAVRSTAAATYTPISRQRFRALVEKTYDDVLTIIGELRAADVDKGTFAVRDTAGKKIPAKFTPEQETFVLQALAEHAQIRVRVTGLAELSERDRSVRRFARIDSIERHFDSELSYDETVSPVWEQIAAIGERVPEEVWDRVPTDLARNLDGYLYGRDRDKE